MLVKFKNKCIFIMKIRTLYTILLKLTNIKYEYEIKFNMLYVHVLFNIYQKSAKYKIISKRFSFFW